MIYIGCVVCAAIRLTSQSLNIQDRDVGGCYGSGVVLIGNIEVHRSRRVVTSVDALGTGKVDGASKRVGICRSVGVEGVGADEEAPRTSVNINGV